MDLSVQPEPSAPAASNQLLRPSILLRVVLVVTFLVYLRTVAFDFVYDDYLQISLNPWLDSWSRIPSFFYHHLWAFSDFPVPALYYRPAFMTWLSVLKLTFGDAPAWYHLFTVLLHLVVVSEVYVLTRMLLRNSTTAVMAASLFALHPTKVECVAWISASGEPLCAVFFFGTFIAYLHGNDSTSQTKWKILACVSFLIALFAKEQAIILPGILAVYEFGRLHSQRFATRLRKTAVALLPFVIAAAAYWCLRAYVLHGGTQITQDISVSKSLLTQPLTWMFYLRHLIFPVGLTVMYPLLIVRNFSVTHVLLPAVALLAIAIPLAYLARKNAVAAFLSAWFVLTLAVPAVMVLIVQPHDRYLYLPSFAFCVALAVVIRRYVSSRPKQLLAAGILCVAFAIGTFHEAAYWDNDLVLWQRSVDKAPNNVAAKINLADTYAEHGNHARALEVLHDAVAIDPNDFGGWHALGIHEYAMGHYPDARDHLKRALHTATQNPQRIMCLYDLAMVSTRLQLNAEAEQWLRQSILLDPKPVAPHNALAAILDSQGRHDEANTQRLIAKQNAH